MVTVPAHPNREFVLKGHPTKGLADGKKITVEGLWKVTGTKKEGRRTLYVIEPAKEKDD
jgi:hypothetical protein